MTYLLHFPNNLKNCFFVVIIICYCLFLKWILLVHLILSFKLHEFVSMNKPKARIFLWSIYLVRFAPLFFKLKLKLILEWDYFLQRFLSGILTQLTGINLTQSFLNFVTSEIQYLSTLCCIIPSTIFHLIICLTQR